MVSEVVDLHLLFSELCDAHDTDIVVAPIAAPEAYIGFSPVNEVPAPVALGPILVLGPIGQSNLPLDRVIIAAHRAAAAKVHAAAEKA